MKQSVPASRGSFERSTAAARNLHDKILKGATPADLPSSSRSSWR